MNANQLVNKLIKAEMRFGAHNIDDGARVIRNERLGLQVALNSRRMSAAEKKEQIKAQAEEAERVLAMWIPYLG